MPSSASCSSPLLAAALPPLHAVDAVQAGEPAARLGDDRARARPCPTATAPARRRGRPRPRRPACTDQKSPYAAGAPARPGQVEERLARGRARPSPPARSSDRRRRRARPPATRAAGGADRRARSSTRRRPARAHQRRPSAGADTTPTTASSPSSSAISVAQTGTPRTKFLVPSIGSITQRRGPLPLDAELLAGDRVVRPSLGAAGRGSAPRRPCRRR